jgi:hypothetical protein
VAGCHRIDRIVTVSGERFVWNGTDVDGNSVPSGVYFYRIATDDFVDARKMVLLK